VLCFAVNRRLPEIFRPCRDIHPGKYHAPRTREAPGPAPADRPASVLAGTVLAGTVLAGTVLPGAVLAGAVLPGAVLASTVLASTVLASTVLAGAVLAGAVLASTVLASTVLPGAEHFELTPEGLVPLAPPAPSFLEFLLGHCLLG
jgi:Pentapeptide repeats (8 copies)